MSWIKLAVQQPITVSVGVLLSLLAGLLAFTRVPIQMTPQVESVVISVSTSWENASPREIESDVIEEQEQRLGNLSGLVAMTSMSMAGTGQIRLEFLTGTDIEEAMAEVDQKLSEVPSYPDGVNEPQVKDVDPESVDYIAWIGLASTDPSFDATTLYDFMERRLRPRLERIPGVSEVGMAGAREKEVQIIVDPTAMALRGITYDQLMQAIRLSNDNFSGGRVPDGKSDIRIRSVGRFKDADYVRNLVIRRDESGPIYLRDIATIEESHKELNDWVRARGHMMPFFNFQLSYGSNLLDTMDAIKAEVRKLNAPGGLLEQHARELGINGTFELVQSWDSSTYVDESIALVQSNILVGGLLATLTLLLFLRSLRTIGIIAIAIPISVIASVVVLIALGRSINIISLAGMAFAVGMVVDNAIVVIENIFRHLEMGKSVKKAALEGTQEVAGAVLASTLTTLIVFFPILLIQESAGQLFRDIALAIMAAVGISLVVSMTVIPSAAALFLSRKKTEESETQNNRTAEPKSLAGKAWQRVRSFSAMLGRFPEAIGGFIYWMIGSWAVRLIVIALFGVGTILGIWVLVPPLDYLPTGNRNVVLGMLIPPPGYNNEQLFELGNRLEDRVRPSWEAAGEKFGVESFLRGDNPLPEDQRKKIVVDPMTGLEAMAPIVDHYFLVSFGGRMFQVAIPKEASRTVDAVGLLSQAANEGAAPDVISFAFQMPLFRTGGTTGSAINIDLVGEDLDRVSQSAAALMGKMIGNFGPYSTTPEPSNFLLGTQELRITPDDERLQDVGMTRRDIGLAVQASADGIIMVREFEVGSELKDLKIITPEALGDRPIESLMQTPLSTPSGEIVDFQSLAEVNRIRSPSQIKHVDRQRAVTLQVTPPTGIPLEAAIASINADIETLRNTGAILPDVEIKLAGTAGKLNEIRSALLGNGDILSTLTSSLFLAIFVVYLLMVVLFQSWTYPLVIMVTVPLATFGGFLGLAIVHHWSVADRYVPIQNLDILTILGFVILAGVVVNNAILIVHQALNFLLYPEEGSDPLSPRDAISESVKSRVRPILMSTLTSVGGMLPLVLMPGSGSELYRGLGAVVTGGLVVSTVFTIFLVPVILSVVFDLFGVRRSEDDEEETPNESEGYLVPHPLAYEEKEEKAATARMHASSKSQQKKEAYASSSSSRKRSS
ncbi:Efflux RND transporter permease subunit [Planctomycetales bacterium 10988]|nr:Efflux RND transporter permease subunit [Planctomycetales bacterium 10988]